MDVIEFTGILSINFIYLSILLILGCVFHTFFIPGKGRITKSKTYKSDLKHSFIGNFCFALSISVSFVLSHNNFTKMYWNISDKGFLYFSFSILVMILLHDAFLYWLHRLMHINIIFEKVHKVHHKAIVPTPLNAMAKHPLEAFLESLIIPLIVFSIPSHPGAVYVFVTLMYSVNLVDHMGQNNSRLVNQRSGFIHWLSVDGDHAKHHQNYKVNFGTYFSVWDRLMRTFKKSS